MSSEAQKYLSGLIETYHVRNAQIARHLGLSRSAVTRKLSGERPLRVEEVEAIIAYLRRMGVKVDASRVLPQLGVKPRRKRR